MTSLGPDQVANQAIVETSPRPSQGPLELNWDTTKIQLGPCQDLVGKWLGLGWAIAMMWLGLG
jgi:hypothetical protein